MNDSKKLKTMLSVLGEMVGKDARGLLIAGLIDALQEATKDKQCLEVRSVSMTINDYFTYDIVRLKGKPSGC